MIARIRGGRRLRGAVEVPGDKSICHRALILGALAEGETRVVGFSGGADNRSTLGVLRALGVVVEERSPTELVVRGAGAAGLRAPAGVLDAGNSGTTIRMMLGVLAAQPFDATLDGDDSLRGRPMLRVVEPLRRMGAVIEGREGGRLAPLTVRGGHALRGQTHRLSVASAQVKSALLLAGLRAEGPTRVDEPELSRDHTERMLAAFGADVRRPGAASVELFPGAPLRSPGRVQVAGDLSSAAFFLAAGALAGEEVVVRGAGVNATRAGFLDVLARLGARVEHRAPHERSGEPCADLATARATALRGTTCAGALTVRAIDELPLVAALAVHATGETLVRDAAELRVKESDRIAAMAEGLTRLGARVEAREDGWRIVGVGGPHAGSAVGAGDAGDADGPAGVGDAGGGAAPALRGARVRSHGDHRIAMALAICALAIPGETIIEDAGCVAISYPGFFDTLAALGADVHVEAAG